jgi:hypothetical protein
MNAQDVSKRSRAVNQLLDKARDVDILVETEDGTVFLLTAVDDFALEIEAQLKCKPLMDYLEARFREAATQPGIPLEQVKKELGLKPSRSGKTKSTGRNHRKKK